MMDASEPTSDSTETMARVPFVGRLHLYLPQFPTKSLSYFSSSGTSTSLTPPPTPPSSSEPEQELEEVEPMEDIPEEEEEEEKQAKADDQPQPEEKEEETTANNRLVTERNSQEYVALVLSWLFLVIESLLRAITTYLPAPIINFFYVKSRSLFNSFSAKRYTTVESTTREKNIVATVRDADGFVDLCEIWNDGSYRIEEHVVQTGDGYLLGLHRVVKKSDEEINRENAGARPRVRRGADGSVRGNGGKKVVYLHHGLLMNSEVWVCLLDKEQCLPFVLAEQGYDVWLGNNRGNKYSKKSIHHPSNSEQFWDFCIDDFAFHDIPDSINYILDTTKQPSLSYIGFSQGTAQAFATLSIHPKLNEKIDVFIALAPAMSPAGLSNTVVDALMKSSPNLMYLFFGRKSILSSTTFWQSILYPPIFVRVIDVSLMTLFKWSGKNIPLNQKLAAYTHLYSYTSVKSVVHWFQIIRNRCFQMFDDDIQTGIMASIANRSFYKVAKFPTRNITTPIVLVYGGEDSLVDINVMLKELPPHTVAKEVSHFEHLDFLWGQDVEKLVFPHVLDALNQFSMAPEPEESEKPEPTAPIEAKEETGETSEEEEETEETIQAKVTEHLLEALYLEKRETPSDLDIDAQADEDNQADEEDNAQEDADNVQADEEIEAILAEIPETAVPERGSTPKPICESAFEPILETLESEDEEEELKPAPQTEEAQEEKELETPQTEEEEGKVLEPVSRPGEEEEEEEEDLVPLTRQEQKLESAPQPILETSESEEDEEDRELESAPKPVTNSIPECALEPTAEPVFEAPETVLEPPSPERVYEAIETAIATIPTQPSPSPPIVTTREQAPVDVHITPLQPSALEPSRFSTTPPTRPASSRSPSRQRLERSGFSSPQGRAARSHGSIPTGLLRTPPREPSAQRRTSPGVALSYGERPLSPMTSATNQNMARSGSSTSGSSISNGGIQVGSGQVTTAVSEAVSENAGLMPDTSRSSRTTTPPPAPAVTAIFSPPSGPRAMLASPPIPIGPKNPGQKHRRNTSIGPNGINSDSRNSYSHHAIEDPSRGGKNRRRGRGRGRGSSAPGSPIRVPRSGMMSPPPMLIDSMGAMGAPGGMATYGGMTTYGGMVPFGAMSPPPTGYRGHGEIRMGMEASLHSDRMNTHSPGGW